ncbi:MAG: PA2779 family protein [Salinisphaera sp.]|nr:PA2779 family protein [Salinisphaera sp.]MDN5937564.1 PA2779 family protein [Salinisphaera sp.]
MKKPCPRFSIALLMACAYLGSFAFVPLARAQVLGTSVYLQQQTRADRINHVRALLAQEQVEQQMVALGVDPALAQSRVASLTDDQLAQIEGRLSELPAGAGVLTVLGVVFLVLLVLELVGLINLFNKI